MRAVIKSGDGSGDLRVRGLAVKAPPPVPSAEARRVADLQHQASEAGERIAALEDQVDRLSREALTARREGHAEGLIDGRKAADDQSARLLAVLTDASATASGDFRLSLNALEAAAGTLASLALARVVNDAGSRQSLVVDTVHRAVAELFEGSVVTIEVSPADFPDPASLETIRLPQGSPPIAVRAVRGMASGDCRVRLRLGGIDLGLDGQLARLRAVLESSGDLS